LQLWHISDRMFLHRWKKPCRWLPRLGAALLATVIVMVPAVQATHLLSHQHDHGACQVAVHSCPHHPEPPAPRNDHHPDQHHCQTCHLIAQVRAAAILGSQAPLPLLECVEPALVEAYQAPHPPLGLSLPPERAPPFR
jgi:hypothetical protein